MSIIKFIFRSLWHFRKQHIAVLVGTMVSTAVLTGALIIGDSVNYSLNHLVEKRLGNVEFAMMTGDRFVRAQLADDLSKEIGVKVAAALNLEGISINPESNLRVNKTQIYGIDSSFWQLSNVKPISLDNDEAVISSNLAIKLNLELGNTILLRVENVDFIPVNAPFVEEEQSSVALRLKVKAIVDADKFGRFSLKSNQVAPYNIFIERDFLCDRMELSGFVNTILVADIEDESIGTDFLNNKIKEVWTLEDAGLIIDEIPETKKIGLRSNRIFIDKPISESLSQLPYSKEDILTYLVNSLNARSNSTPYSFVTASSFTFDGEFLADNEIIINDWLAKDLGIGVSDTLRLDYFVIGPLRKLSEKSSIFIVKDIIATAENGLDNSLMPAFPGLADASSCSDWETGVPIDLERIRDKDEAYWNDFKGTPKAYISISKGKELWESQYGAYTSIRFDIGNSGIDDFKNDVLNQLNPIDLNMQFMAVKDIGSHAANNGVGFGELFLSLSFFVIVAGILLTTLLYSLHAESRKSETGMLSALGFTKKQIVKIRFLESFFIALIGGIAGSALGILYNLGLMEGLNSVWTDIVRTGDLEIFIKPSTIFIGALSGIIIALLVIFLVTRKKLKQPIIELLKKISSNKIKIIKPQFWSKLITLLGLLGSLIIIALSLLSSIDESAGLLLMAGGLFLLGSIAFINIYFNSYAKGNSQKSFGWKYLAIKNASLNQGRSIAVIALLALGSFTILITGANRKTFYGLDDSNNSGTGGYSIWAESTLPILHDLNTDSENNFKNVNFVQFHNLEGDDASCLNLNQVDQPQILGVNAEIFDTKQAFSFAKLTEDVDKVHPWLALKKSLGKNIIPAYADLTVITWGLKKKVGDTLNYFSESGQLISLVLIGGLNNSIFQGNVIIDDQYFREHFPTVGGSRIMLVDASVEERAEVLDYLNINYTDYGIEVNSTSTRLAEFNSVTNTYLSVFMVLGGLGVFIGTIGLGIVLLRNLLDRRNEIALLQSLGFNRPSIFKLIFLENFFLLITGMIIGVLAAGIGILPSLLSPAFNIPGLFVFIILFVVLLSGILWIYFATRVSLNKYLIQSLSSE